MSSPQWPRTLRVLPDEFYEPRAQLWHIFDKNLQKWMPEPNSGKDEAKIRATTAFASTRDNMEISAAEKYDWKNNGKFLLITWNIDALIPFETERMASALPYLQTLVECPPAPFEKDMPIVIMLQEMLASDIAQIKETSWIRDRFALSNIDPRGWDSRYGTLTLVDRRIQISNVFRVRWLSKYGRDGLFVDIQIPLFSSKDSDKNDVDTDTGDDEVKKKRMIRLCNTHLESLRSNPPVRPHQVSKAATYLQAEGVYGGIIAGDMNAIQPSDKYIAEDNGFTDAYLELGGVEDSDDGYTWGYQSPEWMRKKFGCSRMDKVFYCGGIVVRGLQRIGMGVIVEGEEDRERMKNQGIGEWVTDHYGLMAEMEVFDEK